MTKQIEAFESWWADTGEQSLYALNTTTDDDIKILASIAWEAAIREALADHVAASGKVIAEQEKQEPVAWHDPGSYGNVTTPPTAAQAARQMKDTIVDIIKTSNTLSEAFNAIASLPIIGEEK